MAEFNFHDPFALSRHPRKPRLRRKPHPISPELPVLPDELVREILTWLPVKSLMRLKCASRVWLSIITDPTFAEAYRGGFRGLLISEPFFRLARERIFYYASVDDVGDHSRYQFSHHLTMDHGNEVMGYTETLNGLLCFYYRDYSFLYNLATREKLELPFSTADAAGSISKACSYHFGYDPVNKLYKLLKICPVYVDYPDDDGYWEHEHMNFVQNLQCDILTIGVDSSWRILRCRPPEETMPLSRSINGVLYWVAPDPDPGAREMLIYNRLVAFDLLSEKFQRIPIPGDAGNRASLCVPMFSPGLALCRKNRGVKNATIYHYRDGMWEQQKYTLPTSFAHAAGILPNGKLFITEWRPYFLVRSSQEGVGTCRHCILHEALGDEFMLSPGEYHATQVFDPSWK